MRRFFIVLLLGGCAEVSGLSNLDVMDANVVDAAIDTASTNDAALDVQTTTDASSDGGTPTSCVALAKNQTYLFCADFDEGDVTSGYTNGGVPATWQTFTNAPTLSMNASFSAPASAFSTSSAKQSLTFVLGKPIALSLTLAARVQVQEMVANGTAIIFSIGLDATHAVSVVIGGGVVIPNVFTIAVNETVAGDASAPVTHGVMPSYSLNAFHDITLNATTAQSNNLTLTVDKDTYMFTRSMSLGMGGFNNMSTSIGCLGGSGWSNYIDNVLVTGG